MLSAEQKSRLEKQREKVMESYGRLGDKQKVANELGLSRSAVQRHVIAGANGMATRPPGQHGRTIEDFRAAHDKNFIVPLKIRDGLKQLGTGWEYEVAFCRLAGVSLGDLANYRDAFAEHVVLVDRTKRVWAGTKELAQKLRDMTS